MRINGKFTFSAVVALVQLDLEVAITKGESIKQSTKKNLLSQLNAYEKFCNRYLLPYFPCDNIQLCRFGQHLSKELSSPDSIGNYTSGMRTMMALLGQEPPDPKDRQMQMFISGLRKSMDHVTKQAAPITPQILVRISKVVNHRDKIETMAWTALLLGFYMFLRKSNLVPEAMDKFDNLHQFRRKDISLLGLDEAMLCEVRWTKTMRKKGEILRFPVLPAKNKSICPVFWVHKLILDNPGLPEEPLFLIRVPGQVLSLSANQLLYRMRKWLKLIGEDELTFTLHSLRRGGATFAYQSDLQAEMIKLLGDWASDCFKRYIDVSMEKRYDSMKAFVEALNTLVEA